MRIIGGKYGGRVIHPSKGLPVRPTTDRTKEALFNMLNNWYDWEDMSVLDLFSGTGNISLECWSRGADKVISVERDRRCVNSIKKSFEQLGIQTGKVVAMDVWSFVKQCKDSFDLIFLDPPYQMPKQEILVRLIIDNNLIAEAGTLVVEHADQLQFDSLPHFTFSRSYGSSNLSFFQP